MHFKLAHANESFQIRLTKQRDRTGFMDAAFKGRESRRFAFVQIGHSGIGVLIKFGK